MFVTRADTHKMVGSSKQGKMYITFDEIVDMFGPPHYLYENEEGEVPHKVRCEWDIEVDTPTGPVVFSIYDWCEYETPVKDVTRWSIGGHSVKAVQVFMELKGLPLDLWEGKQDKRV